MTDIRTPNDEIETPGYFYPPFKEGWNYQGITYGGHSDFSVDFNRRTLAGGVIQDAGHPVFAQADGTVVEVDKANGLVMISHFNGLYRTESRHMIDIKVREGQKVQRSTLIGRFGTMGISPSSGFIPSPHLHAVHYKRAKTSEPWSDSHRIKLSFYGKPIATSVHNSDSQPKTWKPPAPVNVEGPPKKVTWEQSYNRAAKALALNQAALEKARARIAELEANPSDCSAVEDQLARANEEIASLMTAIAAVGAIVNPLIDDEE